jgi:hypothetical protein
MVNVPLRFRITFLGALSLAVSLPARDLADYRSGDKVTEDIITPVPLMVVDPDATALLKEKEALRVPVIFRFNEAAARAVETELRAACSLARSNFLFLMQQNFPRRPLTPDALETEAFQQLILSARQFDETFPLTPELARNWARGDRDDAWPAALIARVRAAMEMPIRDDNLPNALKPGTQITLVPVSSDDEAVTLATVKQRGRDTARTKLLTVSRARAALQKKFSPEDAALAGFAARWLHPNCFVEPELTRAARVRHTDLFFVADSYAAGQVLARAGQTLDQKTMAALGQLQEKTAAGRRQQPVLPGQSHVAQTRRRELWLAIGLVLSLWLLLTVWLTRRRRRMTLLPATVPAALPVFSGTDSWQQRALIAEQQVAHAHAAMRAGALTQLARLFREKLVRGLISQRGELLEAQQSAAAEMAALERRLTELHAPLQERLRAYERRIADLEQALAAKGQENRELIQAKIQLIRHQMEAERTRNRLEFN